MARDGMRLLSARKSKTSLVERSRSKSRTRDSHKTLDDNVKYVIKPDNPPRKSIHRESLYVLNGAMEFPRPRTSTGPHDISRQENWEAMPRPSTSGGNGEDVDFRKFKSVRAQTWAREASSSPVTKPRSYSLTQNACASRPSMQLDLPIRSSSRATVQQENIGVALGSPSHPHPLAASTITHSPDTTNRDSFLPRHFTSLGDDEEKETIMPLPHESGSKGWKKLFGRGLFNRRPSSRSQSTGSGESTPSMASEESSITSAPLLKVDIPTVGLDRYSVMFDSLLKPTPAPAAKSSLYSRRRSKDLAPIGQKISENPISKPNLTINARGNMNLGLVDRSPLWLFPATPRTPRTPRTPGRDRSCTLPEPNRPPPPTPSSTSSRKKRPESDVVPSLVMMLQDNRDERAKRGPLSPFSVMSAESELDTPIDDVDGPWVRKFDISEEPEWEMLTITPLRPRTPSPIEMLDTPVTPLTPNIATEALIATAAKVSIARQISVSQRQLLLPIVSNSERFIRRPQEASSEPSAPVSAVTLSPPVNLNRVSSIFDSDEIHEATQPRKSGSFMRPRLVDLLE